MRVLVRKRGTKKGSTNENNNNNNDETTTKNENTATTTNDNNNKNNNAVDSVADDTDTKDNKLPNQRMMGSDRNNNNNNNNNDDVDNTTTSVAAVAMVRPNLQSTTTTTPKKLVKCPHPEQQYEFNHAYEEYVHHHEEEIKALQQYEQYKRDILEYITNTPWFPDRYEYECVPILPSWEDEDDDDNNNNNNNNSIHHKYDNDDECERQERRRSRKRRRFSGSSSSSSGSSSGGSSSSSRSSSSSSDDMNDDEYLDLTKGVKIIQHKRAIRRRIFLLMTDPQSSIGSALFFAFLILLIVIMNIMMILQTVPVFQYTPDPDECLFCNATYNHDESIFSSSSSLTFDLNGDVNGTIVNNSTKIPCECPPQPLEWTAQLLDWTINIFALEIIIRLVMFSPPIQESVVKLHWIVRCLLFIRAAFYYMISFNFAIDALSIFPYYIAAMANSNGLIALRFLQLLRVFLLVKIGQYHKTVMTFQSVLQKSMIHIKILLGILLFGALIFGSLIYWSERGTWQYYAATGTYEFVRVGYNDITTISPYTSIPQSFWWFIVTATSVGYGDMFPVTPLGQFIASGAMIMGVLVIAYPVSVFSDLWSIELRRTGVIEETNHDDEDDAIYDNFYNNKSNNNSSHKKTISPSKLASIPDDASYHGPTRGTSIRQSSLSQLSYGGKSSTSSGGGGGGAGSGRFDHREFFAKSKSLPQHGQSRQDFFGLTNTTVGNHHSASVRLPSSSSKMMMMTSRRDMFQYQQQQHNAHSVRQMQQYGSSPAAMMMMMNNNNNNSSKMDMYTSFRNPNSLSHSISTPSMSFRSGSSRENSLHNNSTMSQHHQNQQQQHPSTQPPPVGRQLSAQQFFQRLYEKQKLKEIEQQQQQQQQQQLLLQQQQQSASVELTTTQPQNPKLFIRSNSSPDDNKHNNRHGFFSLHDIPEQEAFIDHPGTTATTNTISTATTTAGNDLTIQKGTEDDIIHPPADEKNISNARENTTNLVGEQHADHPNTSTTNEEEGQDEDPTKQSPTIKKKHHHHHNENPHAESVLLEQEEEIHFHHHHHNKSPDRHDDHRSGGRHHHHHHRNRRGLGFSSGSDDNDDDDDNNDAEEEKDFKSRFDSRYMSIKKDDLITLYVQFEIMREAQTEIQRIFRKYKKKMK